jgi:rRNA processing protein Gar1
MHAPIALRHRQKVPDAPQQIVGVKHRVFGDLPQPFRPVRPQIAVHSDKNADVAEETSHTIDEEIRSFIDRNYERASRIIKENIDILHAMADALMKYETIDKDQIEDLMARRPVREPQGWLDIPPRGGIKADDVTTEKKIIASPAEQS